MTQKERLESIRDLLSSHPFVSLGELEKLFPEVTSMTLRRDIDRLESKGELIKVRGGARSMKFLTTSAEDDFGIDFMRQRKKKHASRNVRQDLSKPEDRSSSIRVRQRSDLPLSLRMNVLPERQRARTLQSSLPKSKNR